MSNTVIHFRAWLLVNTETAPPTLPPFTRSMQNSDMASAGWLTDSTIDELYSNMYCTHIFYTAVGPLDHYCASAATWWPIIRHGINESEYC